MRQLVDAMLTARATTMPQPQQAAALGSPSELPPRSAVLRHLVARLQCGLDAATQAEPVPTYLPTYHGHAHCDVTYHDHTHHMTTPTVTTPTVVTSPTMSMLTAASTPRPRQSTSPPAYYLPLTTYYLLLTNCYLLLATYPLLLATGYLLLTTDY